MILNPCPNCGALNWHVSKDDEGWKLKHDGAGHTYSVQGRFLDGVFKSWNETPWTAPSAPDVIDEIEFGDVEVSP